MIIASMPTTFPDASTKSSMASWRTSTCVPAATGEGGCTTSPRTT